MIRIIFRIFNKLSLTYHKYSFLYLSKLNSNTIRILGKVNYNASNLKVGKNLTVYPNVTFWGDGEIVIGDNVDIGYNTVIFSSKNGGIYIGNDTIIAANCYIIDSNHCIKKNQLIRKQGLISKKIYIGNDVWIAENCTILMNSIIRDGAVIGAKSLVNSEIHENAVAFGIPATIRKYRE